MAVISLLSLMAACTEQVDDSTEAAPSYLGVETFLLDNDLVQFRASMFAGATEDRVREYTECAAAGYTLVRGFSFARHVRTQVSESAGVVTGDAVYTISPDIPRGLKTIDAEVVANHCREVGIPLV